MAAEYSSVSEQTVEFGQPVLFTEDRVPCTRGFIFHQNGSGIFRAASRIAPPSFRGCNCNCSRLYETLYLTQFSGNIAIPEGGTLGEIILAITIDGEPDPVSYMRLTPTAVDTYGNVSTAVLVPVPNICRCSSVSVRNVSTTGEAILVQNANIIFTPAGAQVAN